MKSKKFIKQIKGVISHIHELFFDNKEKIYRKERLDFIEIFYNFLVLKIIEIVNPDSLSFTCKDAIDVGEAFSAGFYVFIKTLQKHKWKKEDSDYFLFMIHGPSLLVRQRGMSAQRLNRMLSSIDTLHKKEGQMDLIAIFNDCFDKDFLTMF